MRRTLLEQIIATSNSALSALQHGRYSTYGKKLVQLKQLMRALEELA